MQGVREKGCAWGVEGRMMPLVPPPLSALLSLLLPSFLRRFLLSSFLLSASLSLRASSPAFSLSYPFAEHPPSMGKQGRSNVCRCTKLARILHGDALETGNRVRDSRHVQVCSCICNKFRVFLFAFSIVRCAESKLRGKIAYRVWREVYGV